MATMTTTRLNGKWGSIFITTVCLLTVSMNIWDLFAIIIVHFYTSLATDSRTSTSCAFGLI